MRALCSLVLSLVVLAFDVSATAADLTLADALARTLRDGPELAAFSRGLRALEADASQARAFPNPLAELEMEDFAGTGAFQDTQEAQTTLRLAQLVELGGKRAARIRLAASESEIGRWDFEAARAGALARTATAFVEVLVAQQRIELADEAIRQANATLLAARERVSAGMASPVETTRATIALHEANLRRTTSGSGLDAARSDLAAQLGAREPDFDRATGALEPPPPLPSLAAMTSLVERSPELGHSATEIAQRDAALSVARAARVPDVEVGLGVRRLSGPNDTALVASLAIPLPLWNRNRYAIEAATQRRARSVEEQRAARMRALAQIAQAHAELRAARETASLLRETILPEAERAVATLRDGYRRGRFGSLEVLDAERARLEARARYVEALGTAQRGATELDRLVGAPSPGMGAEAAR